MITGHIQTAAPTAEPVTYAEAKSWLRVDDDDTDQALITSLITAARVMVEDRTRRQLITATWRLSLDAFPPSDPSLWAAGVLRIQQILESGGQSASAIRLPRPRLQSVTSLTYTDPTTGTVTTLDPSEYQVAADSEPARVMPAYGNVWPFTRNTLQSVQVTYRSGYGDTAASVPETLKVAIKLLLSHWYDNREAVVTGTISTEIPQGISRIVDLYKVEEYT